eukprot:4647752-Prymnesium_polylepis.1
MKTPTDPPRTQQLSSTTRPAASAGLGTLSEISSRRRAGLPGGAEIDSRASRSRLMSNGATST